MYELNEIPGYDIISKNDLMDNLVEKGEIAIFPTLSKYWGTFMKGESVFSGRCWVVKDKISPT